MDERKNQAGESIDRSKVKDPSEVSGWSKDEKHKSPQDYSDIARHGQRNAEARIGETTTRGRSDGEESSEKKS